MRIHKQRTAAIVATFVLGVVTYGALAAMAAAYGAWIAS